MAEEQVPMTPPVLTPHTEVEIIMNPGLLSKVKTNKETTLQRAIRVLGIEGTLAQIINILAGKKKNG